MARAPDPRIEEAKAMYLEGKKLIEIAKTLDLPEGTVRSWKNRYKWNATLQKTKCNVAKNSKNKNKAAVSAEDRFASNPDLTDKQQLFCMLYAMGDNATRAYQKAYSCNYNTAMTNASRLLGKAKIRTEVELLRKERYEAQMFDEHDIFQWYLDVARASITDYVTFGREETPVIGMRGPVIDQETGETVTREVNYVKFRDSSEVNGHIIKKVKMGKDGASIELYDAMQAMDWLASHMSMGTDAQQGLASVIMQAHRKRMAQNDAEREKEGETGRA